MEERYDALVKTNTSLRGQVEKTELALEAMHQAVEEAHEKAKASGLALTEVQTTLCFRVDTVNRALLFTENLEHGEKLNHG
jgi:predicted  nucleic acid-binding Zn-ribbon protein